MISRRKVVVAIASGVAVAGVGGYLALKPTPVEVGFALSEEELAAAKRFLQTHPVIDSHAHPGLTFARDGTGLNWKLRLLGLMGTFEEDTIADMMDGGVSAAVFNGVADFQLLDLSDHGITASREFKAGEDWESYSKQIANLQRLETDGLVVVVRTVDDVLAAHSAGKPAAFLGMEGADFLNNDISRLQTVFDDGVRMLTLVHYHNNTLGDITTGEIGSRGLSDFGREVVAGMNKLGMIIDAAHASEKTAFDIVSASSKPVIVSHSHVNSAALTHPRFISVALAKAIAQSGGFVGAWPAGIGISTLSGFVDRIEELLEILGEDHLALGSDMDANYKPVLETYRKMPMVIGGLRKRGYSDETIAKFTSGNFLRVMAEVQQT